jgi:hypothetical protein
MAMAKRAMVELDDPESTDGGSGKGGSGGSGLDREDQSPFARALGEGKNSLNEARAERGDFGGVHEIAR